MKHPNYGQAPGTDTPKNKAPALGNTGAENKSVSQADFNGYSNTVQVQIGGAL